MKSKKQTVGNIKEAKGFSKDIILIRCFAICMRDEHGQVIYTFDTKKKADQFYKQLRYNKQ